MRSLTLWENFLLGKDYLLSYKDVYNFPTLTPEEISAYQFKKIKRLLDIAYNHTEFYRELYSKLDIHPEDVKTWRDFEKLPTVGKDDMVASGKKCIVDTKRNSNLILSRSSGSSGKLIDIFFEGRSWIEQALIQLRMYQREYNYTAFDKQALIYTSHYPYDSILGLFKATYIYTLSPADLIIKKLQQLQPALIVAEPSILFELIAKFENVCQELKPKAISMNSEQSTQKQRDFISSVFNCQVHDEYSTEELTLVAYQCKNKNYHLLEDASYIEILDPDSDTVFDNQLGEIVGTCLVNNIMPFIRYRQGDLGEIRRSDCSCGNNGRILDDISGLTNYSFLLSDGTVVPSAKILEVTYEWFLETKIPIVQFQVVQQTKQIIEIIIVADDTYNSLKHDEVIKDSFKKALGGDLLIIVTKVAEIPKTPAGKHIPIKSFVGKDQVVSGKSFHTKSNMPFAFI